MQQAAEWLGGYIWLTAFVLGALHALQPGHGKTIVAAYLVGAKGTVRDAIMLGVVVTLTHTMIIYVLAALAQGGALLMPIEEVERVLGAFAAVLILAVGLTLLWAQWRRRDQARAPHHHHAHPHTRHDAHHDGEGDSQAHDHTHFPGVRHSHADPERMTSISKVFLLGVSGGIVPCPEGLAVFLASLAGGKIEQGVLLVLVFSLGLAATLVLVGILFIKASALLKGGEGAERWGTRISWVSAVLITLVGAIYLSRYVYAFA